MPRKYTITYHTVASPIVEPITKFGGQPVWIGEPQWPLSRMYGTPMHFICQIALPPDIFGDTTGRMAYLFMTDWTYEGLLPYTFEPDSGENALIVQPGEIWPGPSLPSATGPTLYRRGREQGRWVQYPTEVAVELRPGEDPPEGTWVDVHSTDRDAWDAYWAALEEDKVGGTYVPSSNWMPLPAPNWNPLGSSERWRLLLQLNAKNNAGGDPFFLNLADDGVGYAFLSEDGRSGKFLWVRS